MLLNGMHNVSCLYRCICRWANVRKTSSLPVNEASSEMCLYGPVSISTFLFPVTELLKKWKAWGAFFANDQLRCGVSLAGTVSARRTSYWKHFCAARAADTGQRLSLRYLY